MDTDEMNAAPVASVPKPHCLSTGSNDWRNVKMSASLNPLRSERNNTIGSHKSMWNCTRATQRKHITERT